MKAQIVGLQSWWAKAWWISDDLSKNKDWPWNAVEDLVLFVFTVEYLSD